MERARTIILVLTAAFIATKLRRQARVPIGQASAEKQDLLASQTYLGMSAESTAVGL